MPTELPVPRTLEGWLKQLDDIRLPIPAGHHRQVSLALSDNQRSLREIADLIEDSPALALAVLREANRRTGALGEPAESLEQALTRLGLKRAEELLQRLPAVDERQIPQSLRQMQLIGQHASQQASGLFGARLARLWQEIHWGSLLFLSPLWPLLVAHPTLFATWERRVLGQHEPASKVERDLLGVPAVRLCQALAEHWRLPAWIVQGYRLLGNDRRLLVKALHIARENAHPLHQQQLLDADPPLRRWLTQPSNTVLLANGLALSAHDAWDSPHSLRWQRWAGLYLQIPLDELQQAIHQQAAASARLHRCDADLWHPARALIWPWQARRLQQAPAQAAAPKAEQLAEWRRQCGYLLAEPSGFANLQQLLATAGVALKACGMRRGMLLLVDRSHQRLTVQQTFGLPRDAGQLNLAPANSQVLQRLVSAPGQLRLNPQNSAQYAALIPGGLKTLFSGEHLLLCSIAYNGKVALLLALDQDGLPFADVTLQAFGKTVQCIERALASFARRGH
ncbi:HDOD domain-containing protein [Pseudomonas sp. PS02288]|uniref:HDOD domain-containing protein n=1 Tax=Pseudomonas sp. PS02288 TaxID=2991443 RepID=UPI00249A1E82|nr:HDOD domain-containing protein [Pseudomonas sp. PS02288]